MGPTFLGHILRWMAFRGSHLMCSQGIYRDEANGPDYRRDYLGVSAKTLAKKATRIIRTRECREAKGKEENEM